MLQLRIQSNKYQHTRVFYLYLLSLQHCVHRGFVLIIKQHPQFTSHCAVVQHAVSITGVNGVLCTAS